MGGTDESLVGSSSSVDEGCAEKLRPCDRGSASFRPVESVLALRHCWNRQNELYQSGKRGFNG